MIFVTGNILTACKDPSPRRTTAAESGARASSTPAPVDDVEHQLQVLCDLRPSACARQITRDEADARSSDAEHEAVALLHRTRGRGLRHRLRTPRGTVGPDGVVGEVVCEAEARGALMRANSAALHRLLAELIRLPLDCQRSRSRRTS
jgi:hypothetical protein